MAALLAPEGAWRLEHERRERAPFNPDWPTRLTVAELGPHESHLVFNVHASLWSVGLPCLDRESMRALDCRVPGSNGGRPTCHAHCPDCQDDLDLAVGLSNGEVLLTSLRAHLRPDPPLSSLGAGGAAAGAAAAAAASPPALPPPRPPTLSLNVEGSINASRCVAAAWVPGSEGGALMTAHRDGGVYVHQKALLGSSSDTRLLARTNSQHALRPPLTAVQPGGSVGVAAAAPSPDGAHLAVACRDGVLRIYRLATGALVAGFKSYYGGLLCCGWSPDGRYVAAGGEDDLVAVFGLAERGLVACGQGHSSWVAAVAFDPWMCRSGSSGTGAVPERVYRLATAGQDCQVAFWEVAIAEEDILEESAADPGPPPHLQLPPLPPSLPPSPSKQAGSRSGSPTKGRGRRPALEFLPAAAAIAEGLVAPSTPRTELPIIAPLLIYRAHLEPLSDLAFAKDALFTGCHGGVVRMWRRPVQPAAAAAAGSGRVPELRNA